MAVVRPIANYGGKAEELRNGDTLQGAGTGGGVTLPLGSGMFWYLATPPPYPYVILNGIPILRSEYPEYTTWCEENGFPFGTGNGTTTVGILSIPAVELVPSSGLPYIY